MAVIGVFCARIRVEEKQIITAFGDAGALAMPMLPASSPMPPGSISRHAPPVVADGTIDANDPGLSIVIDRCANRYVGSATLPLFIARGIRVIGAGLASTGSRLDVASALERAGIARPSTLLAFTEESANLAVRQIGVPAALFPLNPGKGWTHMQDFDTADAVVEHRMVLGREAHSVVLVQAGAPLATEVTTIHLVNGNAIAFDGPQPDDEAIDLAQQASSALQATLVAVQTAQISGQRVIWDVLPAADFRAAQLLGRESMADAIVRIALPDSGTKSGPAGQLNGSGVRHGVNGNIFDA